MNVLIVDDDKLARKGLIAIMDWEKYGFKVAGDVQNGRKALEFLRTHPVDIVFTDIDMPEIDGLELMQMCKEEFPDIKFVIFSVYENFSYAQTAIRMGALDYISKISFSPEECEQILERVSAKYRQTSRDGQADGEDREKLRELSRRWMYTGWIFNEKEFEDLCRETKEISLRRCWTGFAAGGKTSMKYAAVRRRKMISVRLLLSSCMWMSTSGRSCALKTRLNRSG